MHQSLNKDPLYSHVHCIYSTLFLDYLLDMPFDWEKIDTNLIDNVFQNLHKKVYIDKVIKQMDDIPPKKQENKTCVVI